MEFDAPAIKRTVAFFDGQNLFRHAKDAFGHYHPNYDPIKLTDAICALKGWQRQGVRFYTGVPDAVRDPPWHAYWSNRLLQMRRAGILVTTRPIRYRDQVIVHPDGSKKIVTTPQEKGIDVRLALDIVRLAYSNQYDAGLIFSQDQDLSEVAQEVAQVAKTQQRWIKLACAFPAGSLAKSARGIDRTEWIPMDRNFYDSCLDPKDYRPKKQR
jgi:uncharacterized LabA/DUF88 family protein